VVSLLRTGEFQHRAQDMGALLHKHLGELVGHGLTGVRGRGLWAGIDIDPTRMTGREACERLMTAVPDGRSASSRAGVLAKDTHGSTLRLAPPLVITSDEVDYAVERLASVLA
jgi:ornithine--oxo-acid transaminase